MDSARASRSLFTSGFQVSFFVARCMWEGKGLRAVMLQVMEHRAYRVCMPCFGARGFGVLVLQFGY